MKNLKENLTYSYKEKLQGFDNAIILKKYKFTNLARNRVIKTNGPRMVSLTAEQSLNLVPIPELYVGDFVDSPK